MNEKKTWDICGEDAPLDVVAVGAHPDDVEIGCGGMLHALGRQGYRVGIIDLTDGEPTPRSPGPETRLDEAAAAARTLGVCVRVTLALPNRRLFDDFESRCALATEFRRYRPQLVLCLAGETPFASPDHEAARRITEAAIFYARLSKWDEHFEGLPVHNIPHYLFFFLSLRQLVPPAANPMVVDISDSLEAKLAAVACYRTQFAHRPEILDRIRTANSQQGRTCGYAAGEVVAHPTTWGTHNLMASVLGHAARSTP
ncbi:MAG: LmbE family protein [Thermogutta sp.]|nr:LmbE family protein [Thermogutta sp.]